MIRNGVCVHEIKSLKLFIFSSDTNYYALHVQNIERVIRVLDILPIPKSPSILLGIFNLHGKTVPVISLRRLVSLAEKSIEFEDILIILTIGERLIAILSDHALGVHDCLKDETAEAKKLFSALIPLDIVQFEDTLVPVIDIESLAEKQTHHV